MIVTDKAGFETLKAIQKASGFNQWMYETIAPFCHGSILEIGSGIGNISSFLVARKHQVTLSDINASYVNLLTKQFSQYSNVKDILTIDLQLPCFSEKYKDQKEKYDTILLLNVLEHLPDENLAVVNCRYLLQKGGRLIILVPAYKFLFSRLDKELGHYRRYTLKRLSRLLIRNELVIEKRLYFNALGIPAWLYGKIFSLRAVPGNEMSLFNKLTPFAKTTDKILLHKLGLSVVAISIKQ